MKKTEILIIGTHADIVKTIVRLINNREDWNGTGVLSAAEAISAFEATPFKVVLFGGGITEQEEQELTAKFTTRHASVICIRHYGGGSGLLYGEIQQALLNS